MKVFLGGTYDSNWRNRIMIMLYDANIDYFNPIVDDWTEEDQHEETRQKENCDYCIYCITPKMTGVYSIAEVVDDANNRPNNTILIILSEDDGNKWSDSQFKSLKAVKRLVQSKGVPFFSDLKQCVNYLTKKLERINEYR